MTELDAALLPAGAKDGDLLLYRDGVYLPDPEATARREEKLRALFNRLKK